ncbi:MULTISPECIES: multicopper oxidase domain-containing protein [Flavobacterium]|uniref:Multicopper oxidase domain-containing protein n=1 Tax=Flavobacterium jumunjinense TaxID=998845 RepID=A0ABV5GJX2_9FLAO|nr:MULTISPECIES: multicopper oxidase domain-containing protein [Flavobacterium]
MHIKNKILLIIIFLFVAISLSAQNEKLIIGRTSGKLIVKKNKELRVFGFSNSLSGQVTLPGSLIEVKQGDSVHIDFWNISQGNPVSLYSKGIDFELQNEAHQSIKEKQPIDHMEHGFYTFSTKNRGTYLYYSPENYPFNLQAGMFGVVIIRSKKTDSSSVTKNNELLWCSYEIDTNWHTDAIMDLEHDDINKPIELPDYEPKHFLINGVATKKTRGLQTYVDRSEKIVLRIVNAGLYRNEILFPLETEVGLVFGKTNAIVATSKNKKVLLEAGDCIELSISLAEVNKKDTIIYQYIESKTNQMKHKAKISVFN